MSPAEIVRRFYDQIWNAGDLAAIEQVCRPDMRFRGSLGETRHGREEFADYVRRVRTALSEYHCAIEDTVTEHHRVFAKMRFSGIHRAEFMGFPPTGERVWWSGAALFEMASGQIDGLWVLGDLHGLLQRLEAQRCGIAE